MAAELVLREIVGALEAAHEQLTALAAAAVARGVPDVPMSPAATADFMAAKLARITALRLDAERVLAAAQADPAAIAAFLEEGWRVGVAWADRDLDAAAAALSAGPTVTVAAGMPNGTPRLPRQLVALSADATRSVNGVRLPMLRSIQDAYRAAVYDAARGMASGALTGRQAVALSVDRMAAQGISAFVDSAGRSWRPETYAEMALRTAYGRSANQARLDRYIDRGRNLVVVSDAPRECRLCRPWEGKILAIDPAGATEGVVPDGSVAQAQAAGLQHPRCRHQLSLYTPGLTQPAPATPDPDGYARHAKQLAAQNQARVARRRLAAAEAAGDPKAIERAQARVRATRHAVGSSQPEPLFPQAPPR